MRRIFVTRVIPDAGLRLLHSRRNVDIHIFPKDRAIRPRELQRFAHGTEILVPLLTDRVDATVMDAAGGTLRLITNYAVGFDNIDLKAAKKRGIIVTNAACPEISSAVAEHVVALIFSISRRIVESHNFTARKKFRGWGPMLLLGQSVQGATLGIIGAGSIGKAVAQHMHDGFGMKILYTDVARSAEIEESTQARYQTLPEVLRRADIVSLHVPLLPSTHHLIGAKEFGIMKNSAILINTARGAVVDEATLIDALRNGHIAGAGLDVFEHEPHIPRALRKLQNVILTPHTASATHEARDAMSVVVAKNILAYIRGKMPPNIVT